MIKQHILDKYMNMTLKEFINAHEETRYNEIIELAESDPINGEHEDNACMKEHIKVLFLVEAHNMSGNICTCPECYAKLDDELKSRVDERKEKKNSLKEAMDKFSDVMESLNSLLPEDDKVMLDELTSTEGDEDNA